MINAGQTLTLSSIGNQTIANTFLQNNGTVTWSGVGTTLTLSNSTLTNNGVVVFSSGGGLTFSGTASVVNAAGATWEAQSSGFSTAAAGTQSFANAGLFRKAGALGAFTVPGAVAFTSTGVIELRLGGLAVGQFDRLALGSATFGGTLDVKLANGFVPSPNDSFAIATYTSLSGSFATILGNGHTYTPTYGATTLTIQKQ